MCDKLIYHFMGVNFFLTSEGFTRLNKFGVCFNLCSNFGLICLINLIKQSGMNKTFIKMIKFTIFFNDKIMCAF